MCKHCKSKRKMKTLQVQVDQLKDMLKELEGKFDVHALHPYPCYCSPAPYTVCTVPNTFYSPYKIYSGNVRISGDSCES